MIESHEGEPCRLFDQAIYTYLISCRVESGFRIGLSSQASQPDSSARIQLLNSIRHFFKKIPTWFDTFRVEYSTRRDQSKKEETRINESSLNDFFFDMFFEQIEISSDFDWLSFLTETITEAFNSSWDFFLILKCSWYVHNLFTWLINEADL